MIDELKNDNKRENINLKKELDNNKKLVYEKRKNIELKKSNIKGEIDKWGKVQPKKNFP